MATHPTNIFRLVNEARRLDAALRVALDAVTAAEATGDLAALTAAEESERVACRAVCEAEARIIDATPSGPAEAVAQLKFFIGLGSIPSSCDPDAMLARAVAVIEPAIPA